GFKFRRFLCGICVCRASLSFSVGKTGCPAWIRTMTKASKGPCATITPPDRRPQDSQFSAGAQHANLARARSFRTRGLAAGCGLDVAFRIQLQMNVLESYFSRASGVNLEAEEAVAGNLFIVQIHTHLSIQGRVDFAADGQDFVGVPIVCVHERITG